MNSSFKLVKWLHSSYTNTNYLLVMHQLIPFYKSKKRNKMKMDYLQSSRDQAPIVYIFRESRAKRMTSLHVSNQHVCLSLRNLFKKTSWTKIYQLPFRAPPFNKWGIIEHTLWHHHCNNEAQKYFPPITSESGEILTKIWVLDNNQETHHPSNLSTAFQATHTTAAVARDKNKWTLIMRFHTVYLASWAITSMCVYII